MLIFPGDAAGALTEDTYKRAVISVLERFAACCKADDGPLTAEAADIERIRRAYALPVAVGVLQAVADFIWQTAPPGSDANGLRTTLAGNLATIIDAVANERPSGEFWTYVASEEPRR